MVEEKATAQPDPIDPTTWERTGEELFGLPILLNPATARTCVQDTAIGMLFSPEAYSELRRSRMRDAAEAMTGLLSRLAAFSFSDVKAKEGYPAALAALRVLKRESRVLLARIEGRRAEP